MSEVMLHASNQAAAIPRWIQSNQRSHAVGRIVGLCPRTMMVTAKVQ